MVWFLPLEMGLSQLLSLLEERARSLCTAHSPLRGVAAVFAESDGWDEYSYLASDEYIHKTLAYLSPKIGAKYVRIDITALTLGPPRTGASVVAPACRGEECYATVAELLYEARRRAEAHQPVVLTIPWLRYWLVDSRLLKLLDSTLHNVRGTGCLLAVGTSLEKARKVWVPQEHFDLVYVSL
jgi:hypothetical protein